MPLYFSYGSNMDRDAMRMRCPKSKPLGPARLVKHRIFVMDNGYASIQPDAGAIVYGLLYDLALSDVPALDRYEEVGRGLYRKIIQPVLRDGATPVRALVYAGQSRTEGRPRADYWQAIMAAAQGLNVPPAYLSMLAAIGGAAGGGQLAGAQTAPEAAAPQRRAIKLKGI